VFTQNLFHHSYLVAVVRSLVTVRASIGVKAGQDAEFDYDPRFIVFEYLFNILLRQEQVNLVNSFVNAARRNESKVQQMIMGLSRFHCANDSIVIRCQVLARRL